MNLIKPSLTGIRVLMLGIASTTSVLFLIPNAAAQTVPARTGNVPKATPKASPQDAKASTKSVLLVSYLHDEKVQRELKLTEKQLGKIQKIRKDIRVKYKKALEKAGPQGGERGLPPPKGLPGQAFSEYWKIREKRDAEEQEALIKALPDILKKDQRNRLRQISLQERQLLDLSIFLAPEVVQSLKLTKEQQKKIVSIGKKMSADLEKKMRQGPVRRDIPGGASISLDDIVTMVKASREKVIADVLTDEQKKTWKKMLGKRFHFGWEPGTSKPSCSSRINLPMPPAR